MGIIGWIVLGAVAGWLASKLSGTDSQQGWIGNIVMGVVGALLGGFLYTALFRDDFNLDFDLPTLLVAIVGAVILSWGLGLVTGKKTVS